MSRVPAFGEFLDHLRTEGRQVIRLATGHHAVVVADVGFHLPGAFDCQGNYPNASDVIFRSIAKYMAPDEAPPAAPPFTKAC